MNINEAIDLLKRGKVLTHPHLDKDKLMMIGREIMVFGTNSPTVTITETMLRNNLQYQDSWEFVE